MIIQYHPDKVGGDKDKADKLFDKISKAYDVLSDHDQRLIYDEFGGAEYFSKEKVDKYYKDKGIDRKNQDFYKDSAVIKVTVDNYKEMINGDTPIVIEFYETWCINC